MNAIGDIYSIYGIYKTINHIKLNPDKPVSRETCDQLRKQIINGGCIYIKFAQWLISKLRCDKGSGIHTLVSHLDSLFDQCPYHDIEHTRELFRQSFSGQELDSQVSNLTLIASGSVGQVYQAILNKPFVVCTRCDAMITTRLIPTNNTDNNNTGSAKTVLVCNCSPVSTEQQYLDNSDSNIPHVQEGEPLYVKVIRKVAIKVKHPNIDKQIANKMQVFNIMARLQKIKWIKNWLGLHVDFNDFMENLSRQANFCEELSNNRRLRKNFKNNHLVYFPLALTASRDIIISEYVSGQSLDNIGEYQQMKTCLNYASMVAQMVLIDNFCHGDLHRGNWCISLGPLPSHNLDMVDASVVHLPDDLENYIYHDAAKENQILRIGDELRHTPSFAPSNSNSQKDSNAGDYAIIVFDTGICFSNDDISINRKIWEAFERSSLDYLLEIVDYIVVGNYDDTIKEHVREILTMFRDKFNGVLPMFDKLNEVLATYNCCLSTVALNITILFALINETLEKHNLVGGTQSSKSRHGEIVRSKMLDIISYGKSRNIYYELGEYLKTKEKIRHNDLIELDKQINNGDIIDTETIADSLSSGCNSEVELFGKACSSNLIFANPDDILSSIDEEDESPCDSQNSSQSVTPVPEHTI